MTVMAFLVSGSTAFAFWPEAADSSLEIGVGYRQDKIEWKTKAGSNSSYSGCDYGSNSGYSDYYDYYSDYYDYYSNGSSGFTGLSSHLKWHNLNIWQIEAKGKYVTCDNVYLRANADYGWVTNGKNSDSDSFDINGYSIGLAHSHSKAKGHVYDVKLAVGYQFKMCDDSLAIAPLIGYSWHGQHLKDHHLRQSFGACEDNVYVENGGSESYSSYSYDNYYSYGGCHSKYNTRWNGLFIGADFEYAFGCWCDWNWQLFGAYEFHWAQYHARGDWNLRRDFDLCDGFYHRAKNAYGNVFDIGVKWDFCECWTLAVKGEFQWWWADKGHDRAKISEASLGNVRTDCFVRTPLRDIRWCSAGITVDLGMVF